MTQSTLNFTEEQYTYLQEIKENAQLFFLLQCLAFMFFMQAGFVLVECGAIKHSHHSYVVLKNILDTIASVLGFWIAGFGLAYGEESFHGLFSTDNSYFLVWNNLPSQEAIHKLLFQFCFANTSITIISGLVIEKCKIEVYTLHSFLMALFVYPLVAHWAWNEKGWLAEMGFADFAGSGVVHLLGSTIGLVGNIICSSRIRRNPGRLQFPFLSCQWRLKYLQKQEENERKQIENIQGLKEVQEMLSQKQLSVTDVRYIQLAILDAYERPEFENKQKDHIFTALGGYILLFGWFFFNVSSTRTHFPTSYSTKMGKIAQNTILAGFFSSLSAGIFKQPIIQIGNKRSRCFRKSHLFDVPTFINGMLSGLVAMNSLCDHCESYAAAIVGAVAGICYSFFVKLLIYLNIDDPIEVSAVHFANGIWGLLACIIFHNKKGLVALSSETSTLAKAQLVGTIVIISWGVVCSLIFFGFYSFTGQLNYHPLMQLLGIGNFKMGELGPRFLRKIRQNKTCYKKEANCNDDRGDNFENGVNDFLPHNIAIQNESEIVPSLQSGQSKSNEGISEENPVTMSVGNSALNKFQSKGQFLGFWRRKSKIYPQSHIPESDADSNRSANQELLNVINQQTKRQPEFGIEQRHQDVKVSTPSLNHKKKISSSQQYFDLQALKEANGLPVEENMQLEEFEEMESSSPDNNKVVFYDQQDSFKMLILNASEQNIGEVSLEGESVSESNY